MRRFRNLLGTVFLLSSLIAPDAYALTTGEWTATSNETQNHCPGESPAGIRHHWGTVTQSGSTVYIDDLIYTAHLTGTLSGNTITVGEQFGWYEGDGVIYVWATFYVSADGNSVTSGSTFDWRYEEAGWVTCLGGGSFSATADNPVDDRADFESNGGYQAYLADPGNAGLLGAGICDEEAAFAHWRDYGRYEGRSFAAGSVNGTSNYLIDGGFTFAYDDGHKEVILTAAAPKPTGWDGPAFLLNKCDRFNLGPSYSATEYRYQNPDVANAIDGGWVPSFLSVTDHYVKYGFKEGRITNSSWTEGNRTAFNSDCYLALNPDVATYFNGAASQGWSLFGKIGFSHYMNYGQFEGRPPCWY